ncbi:methyltransferase [Vogesella sp. LYT5W]|uniref:Methyltransferase n=1 Tax=Vogesella margarita TaxID=2984199 RepID=A0ABT5IKH1_9NEIS|nr:methyltransferase [Vogesella margarita]MDC7713012.1 methyltransferase [Vogesella margarita]
MSLIERIIGSERFNVYGGLLLAVLWGGFSYAHFSKFQVNHDPTLLLVIFSETLTAVIFIIRAVPKTVSLLAFDWLVALGGSFVPFLLRPTEWGVLPEAVVLVWLGTVLQIISLLSLNRSFALVAAKRDIKTRGMYRYVRHPIYASYVVLFAGYVLSNTSVANGLIYALLLVLLACRIAREERHLGADPVYREYMLAVRYRLIPYVF